jgi:cobalt-zinc-cadmium efflux system outer membrane protein
MGRRFLPGTLAGASLLLGIGLHQRAALAVEPSAVQAALPPRATADAAGPTLTLAELEQVAVHGNPTLAQAAAQVEIAHGRELQSGLYPNPTVGYNGEQLGLRGKAAPGEQNGLFIDQTIVTAGKLRLNRARFAQEVAQATFQAEAQHYRVLNSVRMRFYQLLAMQRLLDVRADLLRVAEDAVTTTEELVNVGAANRPDLLQARIEARQERVALENARALYEAAWQQLAALLGNPCLPLSRLQGDLEQGPPLPDWDATLCHLLEASPEVQIARAEIARTQFALKREQVEPIPNVQLRVSSGYDFEEDGRRVTTTVNLGVRLPVFDKHQGNIHAAEAQLTRAQAELTRLEMSLRQRLSWQYARYRTSLAVVENYRDHNLPEAREAYELYLDSFRKRRAAWPQVLVAQRTYFQISVDYVEALENLRTAQVAILGLLLVDGLDEPAGLPGEGPAPRRQEGGAADLPDPINPRQGRGLENRMGSAAASHGG